jgi:SAM-dependent methyltransferase
MDTNKLTQKFDILINKILKIKPDKKKDILRILTLTHSYSIKKFLFISNLYHSENVVNFKPDRHFISYKISKYLLKTCFRKNMKIADIGGGNGDVIKIIGENLNLKRENLYCVENNSNSWTESYPFSNGNHIQYIFWDNITIPNIKPQSLDVVLIMVTLHHMPNDIIQNLFTNLKQLTKPNSLLILKEHDCKTRDDLYLINWEHHLYYLVNTHLLSENDVIKYKETYVDNYNTKSYYDNLLYKNGYVDVVEFTRLFDKNLYLDKNNSSNLYWKVYKKIN